MKIIFTRYLYHYNPFHYSYLSNFLFLHLKKLSTLTCGALSYRRETSERRKKPSFSTEKENHPVTVIKVAAIQPDFSLISISFMIVQSRKQEQVLSEKFY
jgi:hypothetical protein